VGQLGDTAEGQPDAAKTFLKDGRAPRVGELIPTATWRRLTRESQRTEQPRSTKGDIARQIVAFSEANGGC